MITVAMATREAKTVYLALGTNLGDREANLAEAIERIAALGLTVTRRSSIYETEPVGYAEQAWFLNRVIEARMPQEWNEQAASQLDAKLALAAQCGALLRELLRIESAMGRRREMINGPRTIDLDLLLCDELTGTFCANGSGRLSAFWRAHQLPELILPHPRLHLRRFVLAPLSEIAPAVIHPTLQKTSAELLATLDDPSAVRLYAGAA